MRLKLGDLTLIFEPRNPFAYDPFDRISNFGFRFKNYFWLLRIYKLDVWIFKGDI